MQPVEAYGVAPEGVALAVVVAVVLQRHPLSRVREIQPRHHPAVPVEDVVLHLGFGQATE